MKMTTEEAFVKVLQRHGIQHAFGIIGSAFMPISDLFPKAGITFWDCAHEGSGGMMADGFTRASGKMSMMIAQNGPGITNFVTAVKTAYWNHTPLLLVTPQAANRTIGQGGFQEVEQLALFKDMVAYQEEVRDPQRIAEVLNRVILQARRASAPAQINVPRDYWTQQIDIALPAAVEFERPAGGEDAIERAAELLSRAKFPVILNGAGVVLAGAIPASKALAERLDAPVCCGYQHNDAFPGSHRLFVGAARLQRLEGGHAADRPGRRGAGARHPPQSVLDAARLRHRLLAEERRDHPGRHQSQPHRAHQAGLGRHHRRRRQGRRRDPRTAVRFGRRCRARRAAGEDRPDQIGLGAGALLDGP